MAVSQDTKDKVGKAWEDAYPFLLSGITAVYSFNGLSNGLKNEIVRVVSGQILTVVSILAAIVAAFLAFLLNAPQHKGISRFLTSPEASRRLIRQHLSTIRWGVVTTIYSLVVMVIPTPYDSLPKNIVFTVWVFLIFTMLLAFYRLVSLMQYLLSR